MSSFILPLYGFGLPNTTMTDDAYKLLALLQPDSVKWIADVYPRTPDGAAVLRHEVRRVREIAPFVACYARLPDSFVGSERVKGVADYVDECAWFIDRFLDNGVCSFQVGNEDNAPGSAWMGGGFANPAAANQHFYLEVYARLRQAFGKAARLGSSPVMHNFSTHYSAWYERRELFAASDFVCSNAYYESADAVTHADYGGSWRWLAERTKKPIVIAEHNVPPRQLEPEQVRANRQQSFVPFYWTTLLREAQIEATMLFLISGSYGWADWSPSPATCGVWRKWRAGVKVAG